MSNSVHPPPSSNWLALHKTFTKSPSSRSSSVAAQARKRRKLEDGHILVSSTTLPDAITIYPQTSVDPRTTGTSTQASLHEDAKARDSESLAQLRSMVKGEVDHLPTHPAPGKYLAVDCEMVGVGIDGAESVLARVSLVNFHGAVLLDLFVRPRERVVDYRTQFSGIRPSDLVHAKSFAEAQKEVADLVKGRILVGHAVHNDLKALLLSHPRAFTRDTQQLFFKHKLVRGRRPALRNLVQQELGLTIQSGEHSSVTDARATMALFRLHRKVFEKDLRTPPPARARSASPSAIIAAPPNCTVPPKRARTTSFSSASDHDDVPTSAVKHKSTAKSPKLKLKPKRIDAPPGGGRRGVSSGLSTVLKRPASHSKGRKGASAMDARSRSGKGKPEEKAKVQWWKDLGGVGSKGGIRLITAK
ncbi:ribonuclease H-like domain-containing protein [Trametes gibbosa]|nr:ribonuclease H-like domain-containing protein [Trametes gibbosa]